MSRDAIVTPVDCGLSFYHPTYFPFYPSTTAIYQRSAGSDKFKGEVWGQEDQPLVLSWVALLIQVT